jgi:peptidoglycan endopeptidase LytF
MEKLRAATLLIIAMGLLLVGGLTTLADEAGDTDGSRAPVHTRSVLRHRLVEMALGFLGVPYRWSGLSVERGVDCSGLVKILFGKFHMNLPRSSREQIRAGKPVAREDLKAGDLVFFSSGGRTPTHVGIYIGGSRFLHAEKKAGEVIVSNLRQPWYAKRFLGGRRVVDVLKEDPASERPLEKLHVSSNSFP